MKSAAKETLFAFLLFCTVAWCVADDLLGLTLKPEVPTEVPNLIGQAEEAAAGYDWIAPISSYRYDSAPAGTVLAQDPAPGSLRKPHGRGTVTVRLTVSLGPAKAEIPDLLGHDAHEAAAVLRDSGFAVEEIRLPGGDAGRVARTEPHAGTRAEAGGTVRLYVYAGTDVKTVAVPDFRGMTRGEALLTLFRAGLAIGSEPQGNGPLVVAQTPAAGSVVTAGTKVTLTLGAEPSDESRGTETHKEDPSVRRVPFSFHACSFSSPT